MIKAVVLVVPIFLAGCLTKSPGDQCLDSFRMTLKDPDSGKMISFVEPKLTYTATNSYGARTQGQALCVKDGEKWIRDRQSERVLAVRLVTERLNASTQCMVRGGKAEECAGDSSELKRSKALLKEADTDATEKEAMRDLGFE
ncbi:hypothetical protein [Hydrogenophaga defluvii]|uniref:Lipoprotein n=1 Tax=Hydrogenophaga defluvii TaxID=249410 RepID=A0ABW2SDP6_9BURK